MNIHFNTNEDKIIESLLFILDKQPYREISKIIQILFVAELIHLNLHGRPITGDIYIKRMNKIIPHVSLSIINRNNSHFCKKETHRLFGTRKPDLDYLSASDITALLNAIERLDQLEPLQDFLLRNLHENEIIPIEALIDNQEILGYLNENDSLSIVI